MDTISGSSGNRMHQAVTMNSPHQDHNHRRKKSYLNERTRRSTDKVDRKASVTDSLAQFLAHAQDEDLIFNACSRPARTREGRQTLSSCTDHGTPKQCKGGTRSFDPFSHTSDHISKSMDLPISPLDKSVFAGVANEQTRQLPFDRRTQRRTKSTKGKRPSVKSQSKPSPATGREQQDSDGDDDDMQSFAADFDDDVSISSGEGRSHLSPPRGVNRPHGVSSTRPSRSEQPVRRSHSFQGKINSSARLSRNSASDRQRPNPLRRTQSESRGLSGTRRIGSVPAGLGDLERHSRRQRMKQAYRGTPSRDSRRLSLHGSSNNGSPGDEHDGDDSVTSGTSMQSTSSTRSHRRSGLEGGAFNAFLSDERVARNASKGLGLFPQSGSIMHEQADEAYLQQRKARQELIMDVAKKEMWHHQALAAKEADFRDRQQSAISNGSGDNVSSDEDGLQYKKKRGVIGNLKRVVRNTAKTSKSAAKGTVNVVKDPKRAAKKVGGFAKEVGKETAKMVLDPALAAKYGKNGIKGTVNLTTKMTGTVAKGGLDFTTTFAKNSLNVTTMVVGSTIDGAGKVVNGAAGFLKKDKEGGEIEYDDYDPSVLTSRLRISSLIHKFIPNEDHEEEGDETHHQDVVDTSPQRQNKGIRKGARNPDVPSVLAPTIDAGGGSCSWDI